MGLERQRFLRRRVRGDSARRVHGSVDVRAIGECDPPVAHGASGIELCGAREGADRLRVIESVDESQALVEVLLCGRDSSGDGFVVGAEVRVEGDRFRKAFRRRGRHRRLCARAGGGTGEQNSRGEPDDEGGRQGVPRARKEHICTPLDGLGDKAGTPAFEDRSRHDAVLQRKDTQ